MEQGFDERPSASMRRAAEAGRNLQVLSRRIPAIPAVRWPRGAATLANRGLQPLDHLTAASELLLHFSIGLKWSDLL